MEDGTTDEDEDEGYEERYGNEVAGKLVRGDGYDDDTEIDGYN